MQCYQGRYVQGSHYAIGTSCCRGTTDTGQKIGGFKLVVYAVSLRHLVPASSAVQRSSHEPLHLR